MQPYREVNVLSPELQAGLILFAIVLVLAGNFVLCTTCCPFLSRGKRRCLRAIFVSSFGVVGLAYSLYQHIDLG
jgi:hypothetical protein